MNAPTLYAYAPLLDRALAGCAVRYVLQAKDESPAAPLLLRLDGGAGTLFLSVGRDFPCVALLPAGKSPWGAKTAESARFESFLSGLAFAGVRMEEVDRRILIDCPPLVIGVDLVPGRGAIALSRGGDEVLRLPSSGKGCAGGKSGEHPARGGARSALPDLFRFDPETAFASLPEGNEGREEAQALIRRAVRSVPVEWIDELFHRAERAPKADRGGTLPGRLAGAWRDMAGALRAAAGSGDGGRTCKPGLYRRKGRLILSPLPLTHLGEPDECFADLGGAVIAYVEERRAQLARERAVTGLLRTVRAERKRAVRLARRLEKDRAEAEKAPLFRKRGEILSIHFHRIPKGASSIRLPDPYDGGEIEIPLDPARSAKDNVDRFFRRSARGERALPQVEKRLRDTREKIAALAGIESEGTRVHTAEEAEKLLLRAGPHLPPERKEPEWRKRIRKPRDRKTAARPREYTVAGGYTVLVGRDNRENDVLTFKIAGQRDLWFHVSQSPGSHVVLLKGDPKENPPKEAILEAAALAAFHSKAKHGGKVAVICTERRFVRKPRGAPPGQVTCSREKTYFVDPAVPDPPGERSKRGE